MRKLQRLSKQITLKLFLLILKTIYKSLLKVISAFLKINTQFGVFLKIEGKILKFEKNIQRTLPRPITFASEDLNKKSNALIHCATRNVQRLSKPITLKLFLLFQKQFRNLP